MNLSSSQLLMGRCPRNILISCDSVQKLGEHDSETAKKHLNAEKQKQKTYHDQRKGAKDLQPFSEGSNIRMSPLPGSTSWKPGTIVERHDKPRSYIVYSDGRVYQRNGKHLRPSTQNANVENSFDQDDFREINVPVHTSLSRDRAILPARQTPPLPAQPVSSARGTPATIIRENTSSASLGSPAKTMRSGRQVIPPKRLAL